MKRPKGPVESVGSRLRHVRTLKNMTRKDFADELGISQAAYVGYETNRREIPSSLLVKLLEHWAIDPVWLLTGKRRGTITERASAATAAYQAILEAAQRAGRTLPPEVFAYAISAALPIALRAGAIDATHADVLVKLATINKSKYI